LKASARLKVPHFIVHGIGDETVAINDAYRFNNASTLSQLFLICGAGQTLEASHPW
jgi:hypothetical protein